MNYVKGIIISRFNIQHKHINGYEQFVLFLVDLATLHIYE